MFTLFWIVLPITPALGSILSSTASIIGNGQKIATPSPSSSLTAPTRSTCLELCRSDAVCIAFNFEGESGTCELYEGADTLVNAPGWMAYRLLAEIPPALLDPCASSPCQEGKVCVQYWPPAYIPHNFMASLNYSLPGFACSSHQWLLDQRENGKTRCVYEHFMDRDYPYDDVYEARERFYDAFALLETYDALTLMGIFNGGVMEMMYMKSSSPQTSTSALKYVKDYLTWFPICT